MMITRIAFVLIGLIFSFVPIKQVWAGKPNGAEQQLSLPATNKNALTPNSAEKFIDELITRTQKKHHIPGVSISVVKNGQMILSKGYGLADEKNSLPVDPALTRFPVASISKTFTFTALMQLVENGDISLDDHVADILDFEEIDQQYTPITVSQLMSHSAGFEESFLGSSLTNSKSNDTPLMEFIRKFRQERIRLNGKYVVYSNYGVILAGAIIEKVKGIPFKNYMQNNVLSPLNMQQSSFMGSKIPMDGDPKRAVGHLWNGTNYIDNREYYLPQGNFPTAGLNTTANDMAKFMLFHLTNKQPSKPTVLKSETLTLMHKELKRNHPELQGVSHGLWANRVSGYTSLEHDGVSYGFVSRMTMIPELNLGIFISTNSTDGHQLTHHLDQQLIEKFYPSTKTKDRFEKNIDLAQYAGNYLMLWGNSSTIEKLTAISTKVGTGDGYLTVWIGFEEARWYPTGNHVFKNQSSGEKIAFEWDKNGDIHMLSHDMVFKKIGFYENKIFFLYLSIIVLLLSLVILLINLVRWIKKSSRTSEEKIFLRFLGFAATLWVAFVASLLFTIISQSSSLAPRVYINFPDISTVIGQWLLIATVLCVVYLLSQLRNFWAQRAGKNVTRIFQTLYVGLLAFLLVWSLEFNLVGFQY